MKLCQDYMANVALDVSYKIENCSEGFGYYADPFQHVIIDNCFPEEIANACLNGFPSLSDDLLWENENDADIEIKSRSKWNSEFDIPDDCLPIVRLLNSAPVLKAISGQFGIPKLIPDPYFSGGGLNVTTRGGLLDVHVDGNYHDATGLNRRINVILYLNRDWEYGWGGELGLFSVDGEKCLKKVPPLFNRLFIFDTHDKSFHGLPEPLNFPEGKERRSLILYYYTMAKRPENKVVEKRPHSALWKKRGLTDKRGRKTRSFS